MSFCIHCYAENEYQDRPFVCRSCKLGWTDGTPRDDEEDERITEPPAPPDTEPAPRLGDPGFQAPVYKTAKQVKAILQGRAYPPIRVIGDPAVTDDAGVGDVQAFIDKEWEELLDDARKMFEEASD